MMVLNDYSTSVIRIMLILSAFLIGSCSSYVLKKSGIYDETVKLITFNNGDKTMLFMPIHHAGSPDFYKDISEKVDSLNRLGHITYFERVITKLEDSTEKILVSKKFRKIMGSFEAKNGYYDTINNKVAGRFKVNKNIKIINQPSYHNLKVDNLTAINADVTLEKLIPAFEMEYGVVELNECDYKTALDSTYDCKSLRKKLKKKFVREFALKYRNQHLAQIINDSDHDKILVIYGSAHLWGLEHELLMIKSKWLRKR